MPEQRQALLAALAEYQGNEPRKDDISALGFRV
jgi:serine phosphatase RsbU (regulator of sigma subunit)